MKLNVQSTLITLLISACGLVETHGLHDFLKPGPAFASFFTHTCRRHNLVYPVFECSGETLVDDPDMSTLCCFNFADVWYPKINVSALDHLDVSKAPPNDEQRLLQHLLVSYDKSVRPVIRASTIAVIKLGFTLIHIFNIDEKKQVLSLNAWLEQEWTDERFSWHKEDFGNISQLTVPSRFVWTPDIVLYNNAEDFAEGVMQTNVAIFPDGLVLWAPPVKFRSLCQLDVTFFPFDHQICQLRFGSWIYDGTQLDVTNRSTTITLDSYTDNGEWSIESTEVQRYVNWYTCCEGVPFPEMRFKIHLRRRTLFYQYNIIIPCLILSVLVLVQFRLPCESGEKVTLGLTVLLAYSVFSFKIAENMPETSDVVPLIAIYVVCIMSISAISVLFSVMVLSMRHGSSSQRRVPPWIKTMAYDIIGPMLRFRVQRKEAWSSRSDNNNLQCSDQSSLPWQCTEVHLTDPAVPEPDLASSTSYCPALQGIVSTQQKQFNNFVKNGPNRAEHGHKVTLRNGNKIDRMIHKASYLVHQFEQESLGREIELEWCQIAHIFDALYFWVVFMLTVGVTFGMLCIAPLFSKGRLQTV